MSTVGGGGGLFPGRRAELGVTHFEKKIAVLIFTIISFFLKKIESLGTKVGAICLKKYLKLVCFFHLLTDEHIQN